MKTVILDNGHGVNTPGKRSPVWQDGSQLFEWEFNRDIVRKICSVLTHYSIPFHVLVPEEIDISIAERCRRANWVCATRDCLLVSVHANAGGGTGWECHICTDMTRAKDLGIAFADAAKDTFGQEWAIRQPLPDQPYWISNFGILRNTYCPAILSENFFMDTERDCRFIMSESGRWQIALMHTLAIKKLLAYESVR
jgi:N-acetylmuramoyl-L-alanine amidase